MIEKKTPKTPVVKVQAKAPVVKVPVIKPPRKPRAKKVVDAPIIVPIATKRVPLMEPIPIQVQKKNWWQRLFS